MRRQPILVTIERHSKIPAVFIINSHGGNIESEYKKMILPNDCFKILKSTQELDRVIIASL